MRWGVWGCQAWPGSGLDTRTRGSVPPWPGPWSDVITALSRRHGRNIRNPFCQHLQQRSNNMVCSKKESWFWYLFSSSFQHPKILLCQICLVFSVRAASLESDARGSKDLVSGLSRFKGRVIADKQTNAKRNRIQSSVVKSVRNGHFVIKIRRQRPKFTPGKSKSKSQKTQARKMMELMLLKHLNERINNPVFSSRYPSRKQHQRSYFTSWPLSQVEWALMQILNMTNCFNFNIETIEYEFCYPFIRVKS